MKPYLVCSLLCLAIVSDAQVATPAAGFVRYGHLPVQAVYGVAGNLIAGPAVWGPSNAVSFGKHFGLMASQGHIQLVSADGSLIAQYPSTESRPLLSVDSTQESAVAWLPSAGTLLWLESDGGTKIPTHFQALTLPDIASTGVTSVERLSAQIVRFLVTQPDGAVAAIAVSIPGGDTRSEQILPGLHGPAFQFGPRLLWADEGGLEIGTVEGVIQTIQPPVSGPFQAERMSSGWVHLVFAADASTHWALSISDAHPSLFRLPAPSVGIEGRR